MTKINNASINEYGTDAVEIAKLIDVPSAAISEYLIATTNQENEVYRLMDLLTAARAKEASLRKSLGEHKSLGEQMKTDLGMIRLQQLKSQYRDLLMDLLTAARAKEASLRKSLGEQMKTDLGMIRLQQLKSKYRDLVNG